MKLLIGCWILGLCLASAVQGFVEVGKQYVYDVEIRVGAGTMDHSPHLAGAVYKFTLKLQVPSLSVGNAEISNAKVAQYVGPYDPRSSPSSALNFEKAFDSMQFSMNLEDGLIKSLDMKSGLAIAERNMLKAWASTFQLNGKHMKAGHKSFKSREQTIHGECDVSYTLTDDTIYKSVSHNKDCPNRAMRRLDDIRGYDCEREEKDKADGLVSTTNTVYTFVPSGNAHAISSIKINGALVSQMFETQGVSYIAVVNATSILTDVTDSPGGISGGGDVTDSLRYEFADSEYKWNVGRDLKAAEPFFSSGKYLDDSQDTLKAALLSGLAKQKDLFDSHDNSKESIHKAHNYGISTLYAPLWGMNYDTLSGLFDQLMADKSEVGVMKSNIFNELLGSAGTTAAALLVRDLVKDNKFSNSRDTSRVLSAVPYHIRRPNEDLVNEFSQLLDSSDDSYIKTAIPLSFGHLVRMTCERASDYAQGDYEEAKKCFQSLGKKWVSHFWEKFQGTNDREMQMLYLGAINNLRFGGQSEILKPLIDGTMPASGEIRVSALWAAMAENMVRRKAMDVYFPVYADDKNEHEVRIHAAMIIFIDNHISTTDMARIVNVLSTEKDYELINFIYTKLEAMAGSISPCDHHSKEVAGFFLKYLRQFSQYQNDWGFGVSKTYVRQFTKAKYGYAGSYSFTTVGAHDSTTPLTVSMGVSTTLHHNYRSNGLLFHIRIEGLAKGLIKKFKTMDPSAWKTSDLVDILKNQMSIADRKTQPVRVGILVMLKGAIAVMRTYTLFEEGDQADLTKLMERFKDVGNTINHQRVINVASLVHEQPSEVGLPVTFASMATVAFNLKAEGERNRRSGLFYVEGKYDVHLFSQAMNLMMIQVPIAKRSYGIVQDRIYHIHVPREVKIGVNPAKKELKLSISRPPFDHPAMALMHAQTVVLARGNSIDGKLSDFKKSCPFCEQETAVSLGPDAARTRVISDRDNSKWGYAFKAEYFDCEMDVSRRNTFSKTLGAFMPYNKYPRTPWNSFAMGIRQIRAFFLFFPRAEKCGVFVRYSGSSVTPVKKVELSVRANSETKGERLFLRGRKLQLKVILKAIGEHTRSYRMTMVSESSPGGINKKMKVEIDRNGVSALGIDPYSICFAYLAKYPAFSKEMFDVDMTSNMKMSGKANLKYGKGESCDSAEGDVNLKFEYSTTDEAREALKNKWYYKDCMDKKNSPAWKGRNALPVGETCYMTAYDATSARNYKYELQFEKMTDRLKKAIKTAKTVVKTALLPYMGVEAEDIDIDTVGNYMKIDATLKDNDKVADVTIKTVSGERKINDYPLRINWSKKLRNLKFSSTAKRLFDMGVIKPCLATSDSIKTMDNVTYSYDIPSCWTLMSGHCSETPTYAVFIKKDGGHPVAMKAFIGGHSVDIDHSSKSVKVNGIDAVVSDTREYMYKSQGKDIFKITKWGNTFNIYSFLRVWIATDGNFVNVIPAPSVKGQHCGLCGNYNRNKYDEMTGKDGVTIHSSVNDMIADYKWQC